MNKAKKIKIVIILIAIILIYPIYSFAKAVNLYSLNAVVKVIKPIIEIERNDKVDIVKYNTKNTFNFKIKNYNEKEINEVDLIYNIEILIKNIDVLSIKLYEEGKLVELNNNITKDKYLAKTEKEEIEYMLEVTYSKANTGDVKENVEIKVRTSQIE